MIRHIFTAASYVLAAAVVIIGTIALIAYGNGYSYDFKTGHLVHRGLVILSSTPSGAKITLNGKVLTQKTPYRNTFEAGWYNFMVEKDGYRTWQKRIEAIPSEASLAQYVLLIPQHIPVDTVGSYPSVTQLTTSRDHHRLAFVVPDGPGAGVWIMDTGNRQQSRVYASAAATADKPAEAVQIVSWADDNSHLLIKSQVGDAATLAVIAENGTDQPIKLKDTFKTDITNATFNPSNWRELFWQSPEGLRRLDTSNQSITNVLADHVAAYTIAQDRVLYIDAGSQPASLWSIDRGGHVQQLVKNLPVSTAYEITFATYIGVPEVAVTAHDLRATTLYSNIFDKPVAKSLPNVALHATFNGDGRFLLQSDEHHVTTYDLERDTSYPMQYINNTVTGLNWFDNYHLLFNRDGQIVLSEYDGNYAVAITRASGLPAFSSPDNKNVYVVAPTSTGTASLKAVIIRQ